MMIADIGGYTRFMKLHRMSLAHSQVITGRLLEAAVNATQRLQLVEIEGDAAFFYSPDVDGVMTSTAELSLAMLDAFHMEQDRMIALNMCSCDGCVQAGRLKMKFAANVGEVAVQNINERTQLVGVDVIAIHRMLKNSVPVEEYVLMSKPLYDACSSDFRSRAQQIEEELEGLGTETLYFVDLHELTPEHSPPEVTRRGRLGETLGVVLHGMPAMLRFGRTRNE